MQMLHRTILATAAFTFGLSATSASALTLIEGAIYWETTAAVSPYSAPGKQTLFSFSLPSPLDFNPSSTISNFFYTLNGTTHSNAPLGIQFWSADEFGMFDIIFSDFTVSIYGAEIYSGSGTVGPDGFYEITAGLNGNGAFGVGGLTVTQVAGIVPEPGTWAMLIAGFGMIGFGLRRHRQLLETRAG